MRANPPAFVSYARKDSAFAMRLAEELKSRNASVWLDQLDIAPGRQWDREVESALAECTRILVILSPAAVESSNVMDEVSFAIEEGKTVIPVLASTCRIPFRLRRLQHVDLREDYQAGIERLLRALGTGETALAAAVAAPSKVVPSAIMPRDEAAVLEQVPLVETPEPPVMPPEVRGEPTGPDVEPVAAPAFSAATVDNGPTVQLPISVPAAAAIGVLLVLLVVVGLYLGSGPADVPQRTRNAARETTATPPVGGSPALVTRSAEQTSVRRTSPVLPSISLRAFPPRVYPGEKVMISWAASNADSLVLDHGIGRVPVRGERVVYPRETTLYKARVTGPGGEAGETVLVEVVQRSTPYTAPAVNETANVQLVISANDLVTYESRADGGAVRPGSLGSGERAALSARESLVIKFGDGSAVDLRLNGKLLPPLARGLRVIQVTAGGYEVVR